LADPAHGGEKHFEKKSLRGLAKPSDIGIITGVSQTTEMKDGYLFFVRCRFLDLHLLQRI
jgi:hypothetical protein